MNAKELRIGNYVRQYLGNSDDGAEYKNHKIETFYENGVHFGFGKCFKFGEIEPIPLTEEWLIKLGFIKSRDDLFFLRIPEISSEFHFEKHSYGNLISIQGNLGQLIPNLPLFVHSIQNLFFALTGNELPTANL